MFYEWKVMTDYENENLGGMLMTDTLSMNMKSGGGGRSQFKIFSKKYSTVYKVLKL